MRTPPELAIAGPDGKVTLWATHEGFKDGKEYFHVINGAWDGSYRDGEVYVKYTKTRMPGTIVWRGRIPREIEHRMNVLPWIQAEVDAGRTGMGTAATTPADEPLTDDYWQYLELVGP